MADRIDMHLMQCVQYDGFKKTIPIPRSHEPYNRSTLLWQMNDCWPVASWSITDYYNRAPKAAWYAVKEAYRDDTRPERDKVRPKDLKLTNPNITWRVEGNTIILKSSAFAKYVFVNIQGYKGKLSDNYFDLRPGVEKRVTFEKKDLGAGKLVVKVKSLWEVVSK